MKFARIRPPRLIVGSLIVLVTVVSASAAMASVENGSVGPAFQFGYSGDQDGNVIVEGPDDTMVVVGSTSDSFDGLTPVGGEDSLIFMIDSTGAIVWSDISGGADDDYFNSAVVHPNGDIYAVGSVDVDDDSAQAFIMRYEPDGDFVAAYEWGDDSDTVWDEAQDVVVGPGDNLYVVGYSEGFDGYDAAGWHDIFVTELEPDLDVVDTDWYGIDFDNRAYSIAFDGDDALYIAGRTTDSGFDGDDDVVYDWFVTRIIASTDLPAWSRFGGLDPAELEEGDDRAWDVAYHSTIGVTVGGYLGSPSSPLAQVGFYAVLDPDDGTGDTSICDCPEGYVRSVVVDRNGHLVVVYRVTDDDTGDVDFEVLHVRSSGLGRTYTRSFGTTSDDIVDNATVDSDGTLWIIGRTDGDYAEVNPDGQGDIFVQTFAHARPGSRSRRSVTFDPAGGSCNGSTLHWTVRTRTNVQIPTATECTRDGYVLLGWTRDPVNIAPEGLLRSGVTRSGTLTAVWGRLPARVEDLAVWASPFGSALVFWRTTESNLAGFDVTVNGVSVPCPSITIDGWWVCGVTGLARDLSHEYSVSARNSSGNGPVVAVTA